MKSALDRLRRLIGEEEEEEQSAVYEPPANARSKAAYNELMETGKTTYGGRTYTLPEGQLTGFQKRLNDYTASAAPMAVAKAAEQALDTAKSRDADWWQAEKNRNSADASKLIARRAQSILEEKKEPEPKTYQVQAPATSRALTPDIEAEYQRRNRATGQNVAPGAWAQSQIAKANERQTQAERNRNAMPSGWKYVAETADAAAVGFEKSMGQVLGNLDKADYWIMKNLGIGTFGGLDINSEAANEAAHAIDTDIQTAIEEAKQGKGPWARRIIDAFSAAGNIFGSSMAGYGFGGMGALSNAVTPIASRMASASAPVGASAASRLATLGTRFAGNVVGDLATSGTNAIISAQSGIGTYDKARSYGADHRTAATAGLAAFMTEYISNKLFSGTPLEDAPGEKGYVIELIEDIAERLGKKGGMGAKMETALKTFFGNTAVSHIFDKSGEGLEEVITGVIDPLVEKLTYNKDADLATFSDLLDEYIGGVLMSVVMGAPGAAMNTAKAAVNVVRPGMEGVAAGWQGNTYNSITARLSQNPDYAQKSQGNDKTAAQAKESDSDSLKRYADIYNRGDAIVSMLQGADPAEMDAAAFVNDLEAGNYFYIWNTQGAKAADAYYDQYVQAAANRRKYQTVETVRQEREKRQRREAERAAQEAENAAREAAFQTARAQAEQNARATENNSRVNVPIAQETAQERATPPLPQQAAQITPESVTTPPVPGNAQRGAEGTGADTNGQERTEDVPHPALRATFPQGKAETEERNGPPLPQRAGEESQTLGNPGRLRIAAREKTENQESGSGLRIVGTNRQQQKTAQQRQLQEEGNRAESLRDRGFLNAGAGETVYVRSEERWDAEERAVAAVLRENGIEPTFVTGLLQDADGKRVTSLMDGEKLAIQADNRSQTVQSIAERATGLTLDAAGDTLNENRNGGLRIGRQTENSPAAEAGGGDGRRAEIPFEERQRFSGQRAGEQAGGLGRGAENGKPVLGQVHKASDRRSYAETHGKVTVYNRGSGKSLGIRAAAESSKSQIASEKQVQEDEELRSISEAFKQATGLPVSFTFGTVQLANGREARGVYTGKRFVVQCDDDTYTASQLALHELYHYFADKNPGLNAKLKERILKDNKGQALDETLRRYIEELGPAAGLSENMGKKAYDKAVDKILEEVFADAYAGINDYGARASQFNEEARQTERDFRSSENAAATAQRTGPPEQKSPAGLKKDLRDKLLSAFHTPDGYKQYLGNLVNEYADRILEKGSLTDEETTALFDALYEEGSVKTAADEVFREARDTVRGAKIYVPESIKHEFGDDWRDFQRRAFGQGILLTNNPADQKLDVYHMEIANAFPSVLDPDETDMRTILETIVNVADSGKGKTMSLGDYGTSMEAALQDGWAYDSREEQQAELRRAMEEYLREFADQAGRESYSFAGQNAAEQQKIGAGMTDAEREKILRAKESFTAAEYQGQADKLILNQSEALNSRKHKLVKAAVRQAAEELGMPTELFNSDMELEAYISKGTLDESVDKQIMNAGQLVRLIPVLSDAVNNAVGIEAHDNRYFADYNTLYFANLLGGYIDGDSFIPVRFGIKAAKDGKNTLYVVISDQKINKAEVIAPPNPDNAVKNGPRSASEINIAKLAQLVNHPDIIKYIPDGMLTEEQRSQKWKEIADTVAYTNEKNDRKYKQFIEKGDLANAQRMVDEAAEAAGYTIHAYHGTGRADRVGNVFRADRATSGPMAFFTDSKDIAENYSRDKRDTSLAYDTDYDSYETQFRAKHTKTGKDFAIYKMWGYIPLSERAKIKEKARHVRVNWEGEGEIIYDPQATEANGGWSHQLQELKGDVLKALNEQWLNSGNLFNEEEQYLKVLELAGVTDALKKAGFEMPRYMNPDYREEAVYDVFLKIQNPFDATSMIDEDFIQGFGDFAVDNEERFTKESMDADYWDKNSVSAEEFAERMRNDLERGVTHAWTSIPDVMSEYLKSLGYDGIKDAGGKNGGQGHTVWIPFTSEQIKRTDPITYDDAGNIIPLSQRFNPENVDIRFSLKGQTGAEEQAAEQEDRTLGSREVLDTPALKKLGVKVSGSVGDYGKTESLIAKDRAAKSLQKEARRAEKRLRATDAEKDFANGITAGIYREEDIPKRLNKDTVMELADYYWAMNSANLQTLHQLRADINAGLRDEAEGFLAEADIKPISMIELNERTPERAFRKMFGEKAQGITKWLLDPVRENEAEKIRWYNQQMDAVRKFTDSKGKSRELTRAESALTMRLMEGRAAADMVAGMETKAAIENAAQNIRKGGDAADAAREFSLSSEERDLAEKYAGWLDTQEELKTADSTIVEAAAKKYAELFDDYYGAINDFLVAHGYEPIGYIKGYAPHMQPEENQSLLEKAFEKMGINAAVTELPASIAGQTTFFKPNKRWNPYFLQRNGSEANYDIVKAYQSYVDYMADILYHTDDIMRVRQTANWIRQTYAPEEIRQQLEWARDLRQAPMEDKQRLLRDAGEIGQSTVLSAVDTAKAMQDYTDKLYERISNSTKNSNLVMWLDNYANILAGKQSFADRGWEYSTGRKSLNLANKLNNAFQKANVAGNLSSILNQTAQLPMIYAELGERDFLMAVADLANRNTRVWAQDSDFLTAKEGKELLYTDNADKFINALFAPAGFMDHLVSTVAVRGAFNKAIRQGASYAEAMQRADAFGQAVMGSRAKGSRPLAYESKGFFSKMVHMFQIEAVNSWDHLVSDLPREIRSIAKKDGKGKAAMALAGLILRALIGAFTLNRLTDELYGGTPAPFDVLGLTANFVASGKGLSTNAYIRTIIDNTMEKMGHERIFGTEPMTKEDFDLEAAADDLLYNVMNDVPLVRNVAGVLGLGDQTVPLPGAGGEFKGVGTAIKNLIEDGREPGEIENLVRATFLAATQIIPGGRQISKTAQGAEAIIRGGSYNSYKAPKLQYPLEGATDLVKALLFGKNATNAAKEYWAAGGNALTEKQTALYTALASHGVGRKDAYDAIQRYREIANDDSMTSYERGKAERALLAGLGISDEDKLDMFRELNNAESKAAKFRAIMETGLSFDQVMTIQDKYAEIDGKEGLKAGDKAKEFYLWVDNQSYTAKQKTEIKNQLKYFQSIPAEAERYENLKERGLNPDAAAAVDNAITALNPLPGHEGVTDVQKWSAGLKALGRKASNKDKLAVVGSIVGTNMTTDSGEPSRWAKINRVVNDGKSVEDTMAMIENGTFDTYIRWMDSDARTAGVKSPVYIDFRAATKGMEGDKDSDGKTISGSLKNKVVAYIDSLDLTADQKDILLTDYNSSYSHKDVTWHNGSYGSSGSGSYAPARLRIQRKPWEAPRSSGLKLPTAPKTETPRNGLRIRGKEDETKPVSSSRVAGAQGAPRSGLRIRAK